jgi:hypothetical protein
VRKTFGTLVATARWNRYLTFGDVARLLLGPNPTPKQISRMAARVVDVERHGRRDRRLVRDLIRVLDLDGVIAAESLDREWRDQLAEWETWISEPVDPVMHIRAMAAVWIARQLHGESPERALRIAATFAREKRLRVCLAIDRRTSVWFDERGREYARTEATPVSDPSPRMTIADHAIVLETKR